MSLRVLYLATADARGHLMRAQLLVHALRHAGVHVDVLSTSNEGVEFLKRFGVAAQLLSPHYAVQFDTEQNMQRAATDRNVAHYVFRPSRMLKDIRKLAGLMRDVDLVINDSFHPALLCMGSMPWWKRKVVHIYGGSLKAALISNFEGRLPAALARAFAAIIGWQINTARACIEHDFSCDSTQSMGPSRYRLPTPVAVAKQGRKANVQAPLAAVYLNPHFQNIVLADALCAGLSDASLHTHLVGEGLAGHGNWLAIDEDWVSTAARSSLIVSAPGMAALSVARIYQRPILLVLTDQPEQASNAEQAARMQLHHEVVVWRGNSQDFRAQVAAKVHRLLRNMDMQITAENLAQCCASAQARTDAWTRCIQGLHAPSNT